MLWPNDAHMRRLYYSADLANGCLYEAPPETLWHCDGHLLRSLLEAPSWVQIKVESAAQTKRAIVAGYVFTFMFVMDRARELLPNRGADGASLQKAFFLAERWAKEGATYGDGTHMLASSRSIKDCWREYRSVAHFWAAMEMNRAFQFAPPREILHTAHFHTFMRAAAYMQMFGTRHRLEGKSKKAAEVLSPPESTWLLDTVANRPAIMLPEDNAVFENAPIMLMLKSYTG